jgi:hypothetical protein
MTETPEEVHEIPEVETTTAFCPTCGQRTKLGANPEWLITHFGGQVYPTILANLCQARRERRGVGLTELCRNVYHDDPKGGPVWGPNVVQQAITKWQPQLIERGWMIVGPTITGNGYQLVPFDVVEGMI